MASRRLPALPFATLLLCGAFTARALEIGHTTIVFVDPSRNNRQIQTEIYYPADLAGEDVPPADPGPVGFPPITVGHGYLMTYDRYAYLWEGLVPQGFIVALPRTEGNLFPSHGEFGRDLAFLVAALQAEGEEPGSILFGAVGSASAVAGHSMGGGASFLGAAFDPSITAIFNLAAAETNPSAIAAASSIAAPALLFSGSHDCVTPPEDHQIPMYEALASDCRTWVSVTGASHCQFAEQSTICELGEGGCPDPTITRDEQHGFVLELLAPWLRHTLRQEPGAWGEFQALLEGLAGITYLQDCQAAGIAGDSHIPGHREARAVDARLVLAPNPTRGAVEIRFRLAAAGPVTAEIVGVEGRSLRPLLGESRTAGWHSLAWNGRDAQARDLPAGLYWVRLRTHEGSFTRPLLRID